MPGDAFGFLAATDQTRADGSDEERNAPVQANEVEHLVDLGQPTGGEEKKAAGRLSTAFGEGLLRPRR